MAVVKSSTRVFFIPGTACDEQLWKALWPSLYAKLSGESFQFIHLKIPNRGSMDEVILSLVQTIRGQSANQVFYLVGFSMGGYLASAVSLHFTKQLQGVFILSNTPKALPELELTQRKGIIKGIEKSGYKGLSRSRAVEFVDLRHRGNESLLATIRSMDSAFNQRDILHHLQELSIRVDLSASLLKGSKAIYFCHGDSDHLVDRQWLLSMQSQSELISVISIAQCGHYLPLEQPEQLALAMVNILRVI
jgi:pimeloyl-ACP methyl ester carboxylesterase